jgi:Beta-lactamase class C and other penicillin binding proteins
VLLTPEGAQARFDAVQVQKIITEMGSKAAADPGVPGLSIAVLQKGGDEPVTAAFGAACLENATPMTTESRFKIGSVTKVFTAALIHRYIEDGKIAYDTPIARFFPGFPNGGAITIRNLLEHSSGIIDMLHLSAVRDNMAKHWSQEVLIAMAGEQPLAVPSRNPAGLFQYRLPHAGRHLRADFRPKLRDAGADHLCGQAGHGFSAGGQ